MKAVHAFPLLASIVSAHSAVWNLTIDGTTYPARDARFDPTLKAKRIEWSFDNAQNFTWAAVTNVTDPGIACGINAQPPALLAKARAGAPVTVQYSGIIQGHQGPYMNYLGAWKAGQSPNDVLFFKIDEAGYDKEKKLWANEKLIKAGTRNSFQFPSDIKPGVYILRTDLLALHGNMWNKDGDVEPFGGRGPQFYTHCFNVNISGIGNVEPKGVKFPSPEAMKQDDYGVSFNVYNQRKFPWSSYKIPGPPKYEGKYGAPVGPKPVVTLLETGAFSEPFESKYMAFKQRYDRGARSTNDFVNSLSPGTKEGDAPRPLTPPKPGSPGAFNKDNTKDFNLTKVVEGIYKNFESNPKSADFFKGRGKEAQDMPKELEALRQEGIKLGAITP